MVGRRRRDLPLNPFARNAAAERQQRLNERLVERTTRNEERQEAEPSIHRVRNINGRPKTRIVINRNRNLVSPSSPALSPKHNQELINETEVIMNKILSRQIKSETKQITDLSHLSRDISELSMNIEDKRKSGLDDKLTNTIKKRERILESKGLDWSLETQKVMWVDEDLSPVNREAEIIEYEAGKFENNNYLKSFDIKSLPSPELRALNFLNKILSSPNSTTIHIGDGKLISFKNGVRIIIDSRKTVQEFLNGKNKIWAYVGPQHKSVCLSGTGKVGFDAVVAMVKFADPPTNWNEMILNMLKGDGTLCIKYQINKWQSKLFLKVKEIVEKNYLSNKKEIHSIEVYESLRTVYIGTLNDDSVKILIGKKGKNSKKVLEKIKLEFGEEWKIYIQKLV